MSYPELSRRAAVAVKIETTAGTYNEPSFTDDAVRCSASEPEELFLAENDRNDHQTGGLGKLPGAVPAGRAWRVRLQFPVQGAGAAYSASVKPQVAAILRMAGMTEAIVTTSSSETATYTQNDDPTTTGSVRLRISGKEYALKGAACESFSLEIGAGGMPIADCVLIGVHQALTETALGSITYTGPTAPPIWKGSNALVVGGYSPLAQTLSLDLGLQVEPNVSANATDALLFYKIVDRTPILTVSARVPALSGWDPRAAKVARTTTAVDVLVGATQYNRLKLDVDNGTYIDVQDEDANGMRNYTAQILCGVHATNELTFLFD
jgi:hypothetical protein